MASGTSYFNGTLYCKAMSRFWPLWALWGVIWLFAIPLMMLNEYFNDLQRSGLASAQYDLASYAGQLPECLQLGLWLAIFFAVLCAMAVFGYLYNTRSACMMHALPVRREGLFITQYLAGLSFLLLPLAAVGTLTLAVVLAFVPSAGWAGALTGLGTWLAGLAGICLFFFSFASFCAMFTGHILALPAFYGILNCLVLVIHTLITQLMADFFYGYRPVYDPDWVAALTPAYRLLQACRFEVTHQWVVDGVELERPIIACSGLESPGVIAVYAAVGAAFALAALWVYRRRHVETAGDVVSVSIVRPVFKYGVSLCAGLSLGMFTASFFGWSQSSALLVTCTLVWAAVGYFVAEMLLKRSFRVFRAWKGCVAAVLAMALLCGACIFDLFGVEDRVPAPEDVATVELHASFLDYSNWRTVTCTADEDSGGLIDQITQLHRAILAEKDTAGQRDWSHYVELNYTLKNGSELWRRYYDIPVTAGDLEREGSFAWCADRLARDSRIQEKLFDFDGCERGEIVDCYFSNVYGVEEEQVLSFSPDLTRSQQLELWQAVRADFDAGRLTFPGLFREEDTYQTRLGFDWQIFEEPIGGRSITSSQSISIPLSPQMTDTLACMERLDALGEDYLLVDRYGEPIK